MSPMQCWVHSPSMGGGAPHGGQYTTRSMGLKGLFQPQLLLPLKPDKVHPVKQQLSSIHPEVLLFLAKIKRLSVREANKDPKLNTLCEVSISSETEFASRKNVSAESYTLHLSAEENSTSSEGECSYYMWRQRFPVKQQNTVERRMEVEEWVITLALPIGQPLSRGTSSPGIYAFLPTEMVTNFPFLIQADFVLASSRETILLDNKWNQGILDCVPSAFISAFVSLVKSSLAAPVSTLANMFTFLPVTPSSYPKLNMVRDSIKMKLMEESILPSESNSAQKFFYKPGEVGRILPAFWNILVKAQTQGVSLHNISTHGKYVLSSAFDNNVYDDILNFLEVKGMENEWYAKCIRGSNLVLGVSEDLYIEILDFLFGNLGTHFQSTDIKNIPLLKYIGKDGIVSLLSIAKAQKQGVQICLSKEIDHISWLIDWNNEFRCFLEYYFIPKSTQEALASSPKRETVRRWLIVFGVRDFSVFQYVDLLFNSIHGAGSKLVISSAHLLYHSLRDNYLSEAEVDELCKKLPLVDNYGCVTTERSGVLVPARDSNWVALMGTNPWRGDHYVELTEDYSHTGNFAGSHSKEKQLMAFLKKHIGASDIPHICPPDNPLPTVNSPLTKANTFLLLEWIRKLRSKGKLVKGNFSRSIREGWWLRTCLGDSASYSYSPPYRSFLFTTDDDGILLQNGSELVDIAVVDVQFYGNKIIEYKEELEAIGVRFEFGEACKYMGRRLMSVAANSNLTRSNVISMLKFIRLLREKYIPLDDFIDVVKNGRWLKTQHGDLSPVDSILFDSEWKVASQISNLPLIDTDHYGDDISKFKEELKLLGVKVGFQKNYQTVVDFFRFPSSLTVEATYLILECVRHTNSPTFLIELKDRRWLDTGISKTPSECFLFSDEWGYLLKVFNGFPSINEKHYGPSIVSYKNELKELGVVVDFDEAAKVFYGQFKQHASSSSITKENVLSFLACYRNLKKTSHHLPKEITKCLREEKWLQTRLGARVPKDTILFDPDWKNLSAIVSLPLIDDSDTGYGREILEFRAELKELGVVAKFSSGMQFVVSGLNLPTNSSVIPPTSVLSLMDCIKILLKENTTLPEEFLKHVNGRWLKTHMGYRDPASCLLFGSQWNSLLQPEDGPFIDDVFYCCKIATYSRELEMIGVTVDVRYGCSLIANHLQSHSEFTIISRIYKCLHHFKWEPKEGAVKEHANEARGIIFIPNGRNKGRWVCPEECVIYDKDNLFGFQLNVLEKHYEKDLLDYFCIAFGVRRTPNVDDYCKLWNRWESTRQKITPVECRAFWLYIATQWNSNTEKLLSEILLKLPVSSKNSEDILLFEKDAILIPDDLRLQDCLEKASPDPLFVWYPKPSFPSVTKSQLNEIFANVGVRTISGSVNKERSSLLDSAETKQISSEGTFIKRGLIQIVLAYLADPCLETDFKKRHQMVKYLLDLMVFETEELITASYGLNLPAGRSLKVEVSQLIRWERENMKLFTQKVDRCTCGHKENIAYATYFAEVIAEGLLWEKADQIAGLSELIKVGWLLDFEDEAISFLLKTKNLELCFEDEEFIKSAFALD